MVQEALATQDELAGLPTASSIIPLISVGGVRCADYAISGQLRPTDFLRQSPQLSEQLRQLGVRVGRCWLVKDGAEFPLDESFHWYRFRPNFLPLSPTDTLIYETRQTPSRIPASATTTVESIIEPYQFDVLTADEFAGLSAEILAALQLSDIPKERFLQIERAITNLQARWQTTFDQFGHDRLGELAYQDLTSDFKACVADNAKKWVSERGRSAINVISTMLQPAPPKRRKVDWKLLKSQRKKAKLLGIGGGRPRFDRPIFIVSTPRAGSTLLFETLAQLPNLWTIGIESHETIEGIPELHPAAHDWESNRLTAADATASVSETLKNRIAWQLENRTGTIWLEQENAPTCVRFLEKTPKNALRIPFLKTVFPDALFIYLYRERRANISSMVEGWRTLRFIAYPQVVGWPFKAWNFLLTPGWRSLADKPLIEIVAEQWHTTQRVIQDDLATLPVKDWLKVDYANLVAQPAETVNQIVTFADLRWDEHSRQRVTGRLPVSRMVLSAPDPQKWRKNEAEMKQYGVNTRLCS